MTDATLSDPALSAPAGLNPGYIDPATSGNNGSSIEVASRLETVDTSCPTSNGAGQDAACLLVKLTARLLERDDPVVLQGTRRVTSYALPGTKPIARFTSLPNPPQRNQVVTFDATTSTDPRGGSLTYLWDFGDGSPVSNSGPVVTHTYTTTGNKTVTLQVTNSEGTALGPRHPNPCRESPAADRGHLGRAPQRSSLGEQVGRGHPHELRSGDRELQLGLGTGRDPRNGDIDICAGQMTCTVTGVVNYSTAGSKVVRLTVTDAAGNTTTVIATVTVGGNVYYVSTAGSDSGACGPVSTPCATINRGITRARDDGLTTVQVATGTYARFDVISGISVQGGFSSDFQNPDAGTSTVTVSKVGSTYSGILANAVRSATTVSGFRVNGVSADAGAFHQGVIVENGTTTLTLDDIVVTGGSGAAATGVLVQGASTVALTGSTVGSGTPVGVGQSAYGLRVIGSSTANVTGGTISAASGVAAVDAAAQKPTTPSVLCNGSNGGNASGPSSPGGGGGVCAGVSGTRLNGGGGTGGQLLRRQGHGAAKRGAAALRRRKRRLRQPLRLRHECGRWRCGWCRRCGHLWLGCLERAGLCSVAVGDRQRCRAVATAGSAAAAAAGAAASRPPRRAVEAAREGPAGPVVVAARPAASPVAGPSACTPWTPRCRSRTSP